MPRTTPAPERLPVMTSGLVVTLDPDRPDRESVLAALTATPALTVGEPVQDRVPVALETDGADASEQWTDWLRRLPGVIGVEVVFVHWDEVDPEVTHDGV